jgi:hypothetical protein
LKTGALDNGGAFGGTAQAEDGVALPEQLDAQRQADVTAADDEHAHRHSKTSDATCGNGGKPGHGFLYK